MLNIGRYAAALFCIAAGASACGGSGSTATPPPPNPLYVSVTTGSDTNLGDQAHPLKSVSRATQLAFSNYRIFVGPGTYGGGITTVSTGTAQQGLQIIADPSGAQTGDQGHAGPVVIDAAGATAGFQFNHSPGSLIDGFTVINATDAGILVKSNSDNFVIQNCTIHDNRGNSTDGIRVQDSASVLIFNNLIYNNSGMGINIVASGSANTNGSPNAHLINNTIYGNTLLGITVGNAAPKPPSPGAFIRNNIVQSNQGDVSIKVFTDPLARSEVGYSEDYDLVSPATFLPGSPDLSGRHDVRTNATFTNPTTGDFHIVSGNVLNVGAPDLGNLTTVDNGVLVPLPTFLARRTMTVGTGCDTGTLDIGFHYAATGSCP